jgi:hypothetical protein
MWKTFYWADSQDRRALSEMFPEEETWEHRDAKGENQYSLAIFAA